MNPDKITLDLINRTFEECISRNRAKKIINEILKYDSSKVTFIAEEERAFPGNKEFYESGYYKVMLKRYFYAGAEFAKHKKVLDTCCGLGWGTYIVSHYAKQVTAFDLDPSIINFCTQTWNRNNINWLCGNALGLDFLGEKKFDIALGMETIEHFSKEDGEKYVAGISGLLKRNGFFIGTSYFPLDRKEANEVCAKNPFHLYIFTLSEMENILKKYFSEVKIVNNWMFIGKK